MGNELREWITQKINGYGWSISELARRSDLSVGYTSRVISGQQKPGAKFYQGVAKAFDLTLEAIERLDREGIDPVSPDDPHTLDSILEIIKKMTPEQRRKVLEYAIFVLRQEG